jgi:hypothetical protein
MQSGSRALPFKQNLRGSSPRSFTKSVPLWWNSRHTALRTQRRKVCRCDSCQGYQVRSVLRCGCSQAAKADRCDRSIVGSTPTSHPEAHFVMRWPSSLRRGAATSVRAVRIRLAPPKYRPPSGCKSEVRRPSLELGGRRCNSCHPDQFTRGADSVTCARLIHGRCQVQILEREPTTRLRMVREDVANVIAAGFDSRSPLQTRPGRWTGRRPSKPTMWVRVPLGAPFPRRQNGALPPKRRFVGATPTEGTKFTRVAQRQRRRI